jgi:hypothetical protein
MYHISATQPRPVTVPRGAVPFIEEPNGCQRAPAVLLFVLLHKLVKVFPQGAWPNQLTYKVGPHISALGLLAFPWPVPPEVNLFLARAKCPGTYLLN